MSVSSCSKSVMFSMEIGFEGHHRRREKGEGIGAVGIYNILEGKFERVKTCVGEDDNDGLRGWGFCYGLVLTLLM